MLKSGIYLIISTLDNKKIYVGSAINLKEREKRHFRDLKKLNHFNKKLQHYYNKYGPDCFEFHVIQHVSPKYLLQVEQKFLDNLKPFFNICTIAGSRQGCKSSIITRKKISDSWQWRKPISMFSRLFKPVL